MIVIIGLIAGILTLTETVRAQEWDDGLTLKSVTFARVLGLDPIPGDALLYSGHPGQAAGSLLMAGAGAGLFLLGTRSHCSIDYEVKAGCGGLGAFGGMGLGVLMYLGSLIWDYVGGVDGTEEYNEKAIARPVSFWSNVEPTVAVTNDGAVAGVRIRF
ncbi:MAG: hypothetical protein V1495_04135 [Pseudomonadota bacterium]